MLVNGSLVLFMTDFNKISLHYNGKSDFVIISVTKQIVSLSLYCQALVSLEFIGNVIFYVRF